MSEWIVCPYCNLKHRQRPDGQCPRCKQPLGESSAPASDSPYGPGVDRGARAGASALPEVYDGSPLPGSQLDRAAAAPATSDQHDSPWSALFGGLFLIGCAIYLHTAFTELASGERESLRVWWGIALLYNTLGPGITVAVLGILGAFMTWTGARRLF